MGEKAFLKGFTGLNNVPFETGNTCCGVLFLLHNLDLTLHDIMCIVLYPVEIKRNTDLGLGSVLLRRAGRVGFRLHSITTSHL